MDANILNEVPVYELFDLGSLNNIALVSAPAIKELFLAFSDEQHEDNFQFEDDEKHIVTGPAMIPNKKIIRCDENGENFYVFFSEETIERISQSFLKDNKNHSWNLQHETDTTGDDVYIIESWIVENPDIDKSKQMGFNVPKGTWMISAKICNDDIWRRIKSGELRGFSIDGSFLQVCTEKDDDYYDAILKKIEDLVSNCE